MSQPLLAVSKLHKRYPGVHALNDVQIAVGRGEVHALLGENGAGKSTLLKVLSGATRPDAGEMVLDGKPLDHRDTPHRRQQLGIVTIYQEFNLVPTMTVAENLFLGREPSRGGLVDWRKLKVDAKAVLSRIGLPIDPDMQVSQLSVASQQMVEIARALTLDARVIIMDEPTAALSNREVEGLHKVIRDLKASGVSIIYVTHRLAEVKQVCDRYSVLRDGKFVTSGDVASAAISDFVSAMVGRDIQQARRSGRSLGAPVLRVEQVSKPRPGSSDLKGLSLSVRAGEIVGLAGLVGAGRTELARLMFGADRGGEGVLWLDTARAALFNSPREAMNAGMAMLPEDRKAHGCFMPHSVRWNLSLPSLGGISAAGIWINERSEKALVDDFVKRLRIRTPSDAALISSLSGGNQQKVLLARCMALKPRVLIIDEPTRGVDIGAKAEVHQILFDLAASGVAVIVISSDLPELLELADRISVLHEGASVGELPRADATEQRLMTMMMGQAPVMQAAGERR
jgi:inositol transport system ATP-binding protein